MHWEARGVPAKEAKSWRGYSSQGRWATSEWAAAWVRLTLYVRSWLSKELRAEYERLECIRRAEERD